jgi:hypothetical protein
LTDKTYLELKKEAEALLSLAAVYAGDGALKDAVSRAEKAIRVLREMHELRRKQSCRGGGAGEPGDTTEGKR